MVDKAFLITDMIDESSVKHRLDEIKEKNIILVMFFSYFTYSIVYL